jgi:hypothetical protein
MAGAILYLARLLYSNDGEAAMARLDKTTAPRAMSDQAGRFVFPNVEPDTYALIYSAVTSEFVLKDPDSNEDLLITVTADQIIDLGQIYVELP